MAQLETDFLDNAVLYSLARTEKRISMCMDPICRGVRNLRISMKRRIGRRKSHWKNLTDKTQTNQSPPQSSNRNFKCVFGQKIVMDRFCALSWPILDTMPSRCIINGLWIALRILDCRSNCWSIHLLTHLYITSITIFGGWQPPSGLDKLTKVKLVSQIFRASFFYSTLQGLFAQRSIAPFVSGMHLERSSIDARVFQASWKDHWDADMNTSVNLTTVGFLGCRRQGRVFFCSAVRGVDSALVGEYGVNDFEGLLNLGSWFQAPQ